MKPEIESDVWLSVVTDLTEEVTSMVVIIILYGILNVN